MMRRDGMGMDGRDGREKERNLIIFVTESEIKGKKR